MAKNVTLSDAVVGRLDALRGSASYDAVVRRLLDMEGGAPRGRRGVSPAYAPLYSLEVGQSVLLPWVLEPDDGTGRARMPVNGEALRQAVMRAERRAGMSLRTESRGAGLVVTRMG